MFSVIVLIINYTILGAIVAGLLMVGTSVLKSDSFKKKIAEEKAQKIKNKKLKNRNQDAMVLKGPTKEFIKNTMVVGDWDYGSTIAAINYNIFTEDIERYNYTRYYLTSYGSLDKEKAELFKTFFNSDNFSKTELEEISYLILLKIHTFFPSFASCLTAYEDREKSDSLRKKATESMWEILNEVTIDTMIPLLEAKKENKELEKIVYDRQLKSLEDLIELDKEIYSRYKGS